MTRITPSFVVAALCYLATAIGTGLLAILYSSAVPGLPGSEDCGMQFLAVLPFAVLLLVVSVPAVIAADRLGVRGFLKWYAPTAGVLALAAASLPDPTWRAPLVVSLVLWMAMSIYGFTAVGRIIRHRRRSA